MPLTRSLALLAAFGALANSLRSNSASALIRTLLRCSARPNGGGIPHGSSASRTSPEWLARFAHIAGVGLPHFSRLTSLKGTARRATTPDTLIPHASLLTPPSTSPLLLLTPHSYDLTPHPYDLTPHPSPLIHKPVHPLPGIGNATAHRHQSRGRLRLWGWVGVAARCWMGWCWC